MALEDKEDSSKKCTDKIKAEPEEDGSSGHTCGVCGRSFPLLSSLSQHMRRHTREKPYKCPYCEHRTAQKGSLKAHIRSHKLGLLTQSSSESQKEADRDQVVKDKAAESPNPPEMDKMTDKKHKVNGKVKKKAAKKKVKSQDIDDGDDSGPFTCTVCSQVFPQVLLLKTHMKRHRSVQDHGCKICGRRFRQAWFLQSHMRIHRVKAQMKSGKNSDLPATINGVPQDPVSLINDECLYELCACCGNFFHDLKTLQAHEMLHWLNQTRNLRQSPPQEDHDLSETDMAKKLFMKSLNLTSAGAKENSDDKSQDKRIVALDPVCSYQAWQLATKGRLAEVTEKCLGWEERLADAEVVYDMEKGEYIPLKQDKKRKQTDNPSSSVKKKKTETGLCSKTPDNRICQDRILLNGLGHAFYEALQAKKVKDTNSSAKGSMKGHELEDKKPMFCEHCDFHTEDASLLRSHQLLTHQDVPAPKQTSSKSSRYMDYLRTRSALLSQSYWNPYTYTPVVGSSEVQNVKTEKSNSSEVKGEPGVLLNLSVVEGDAVTSIKSEGLVKNLCPYCSHTSNYPEVMWIHQRVAHRVDGSSTMAPKWAPSPISFKSLKAGSTPWRRTGPPPFLEGKDCPALPAPRTQRTQPPRSTASSSGRSSTSSNSSSKHSGPKGQSAAPKPKSTHPKDSRSADETGRVAPPKTAITGSSKGTTSSGAVGQSKTAPSAQPSPKHRSHRVKSNLPQEGLGFMLARNHHSSTSSNSNRLHPQRQSCEPSPGLKGHDLWAALNMWGLHGGKAYLDPLLFAQGKGESTGQMPMDINILSLLKNYSPHDLAALYQHWGFVDPRLDPQAMLQLNEHYANATEGSKQVNSHSTSSGSLHKGT